MANVVKILRVVRKKGFLKKVTFFSEKFVVRPSDNEPLVRMVMALCIGYCLCLGLRKGTIASAPYYVRYMTNFGF